MPKTVIISVSMPENEFSAVEEIRTGTGFTRSEFIRFLIREDEEHSSMEEIRQGLRSDYVQNRVREELERNTWGR